MFMSCCLAPPLLPFPPKDPLDVLDYGIDFSAQMTLDNDTLASIVGIVSTPAGLTASNLTLIGNIAVGFIAGGLSGVNYILGFEVVTTGGRTYTRSGTLLVAPVSGQGQGVLPATGGFQFGASGFGTGQF
jgi:hypothetical protein